MVLFCVALCFLIHPYLTTSVTLSPCGTDNTLELVENTASNQVTCTGFTASDTAVWRVLLPADNNVATCVAPPGSSGPNTCINGIKPPFTASRTVSDRTSLTVDTTDEATYGIAFKGATLVCRTNTQTNDQGDQCRMDLVAIPGNRRCDVRYNAGTASSWTLTANCTVSGAYSFLNRYNCQLVQTSPSSYDLGSVVDMAVTPNGKYKTGTCDITVPFRHTNGTYSYKMVVTPGRVDVPAGFETGPSFQIVRPTAPTITTCSPNGTVPANTAVRCTCTTSSVGQPQGRLKWVKVADGSQISAGGYGSTTLQMTSQTVTLSDHDVNKFRCDVDWVVNVTGQSFRASVGYPPSQISLRLNGNQGNEMVHETQSVTFDCAAGDGRPTPTVRLVSRANGTEVHSELSPLTYSVMARCEDSGVYVCTARNGMGIQEVSVTASLTVQCSPRGDEDVGEVTFHAVPVSVRFDVTAFPTPSEVTFTFLGSSANGTGSPQTEPDGIRLEGVCGPHKAVVFRSTCFVIVSNGTTQRAAGFYRVTVTNTQGSAHFRLQVKYKEAVDTTTDGGTAEVQSNFGVAVGLGVVLSVNIIVIVITVLWLKRRHWVLPCAESNQLHRTASKEPQATEQSLTKTETCSQPDPTEETGSAWPRGPYDSLQMSDIGLRSVYSEIGPSEGRDTRPASRDAEYEITPR